MYALHTYDVDMFGKIDFPGFEREAVGVAHWMFSTALKNCSPDETFISPTDEIWYALEHYVGGKVYDLPDNLLRYVEAQAQHYHINAQSYFCQSQPVELIATSDKQRGVALVFKDHP